MLGARKTNVIIYTYRPDGFRNGETKRFAISIVHFLRELHEDAAAIDGLFYTRRFRLESGSLACLRSSDHQTFRHDGRIRADDPRPAPCLPGPREPSESPGTGVPD